ncbi:hypothetical protein [Pedobacter xixiisoli]|uniref:Neutral/alkaline non-lysosomal ceramidase, N-terminal n=1 Tax=Pedobacter xixiisoli TaxID=1476464 RepID=A0A285ZYS7_9SPHI|nr:hypothetical protein [Pedobacter xixiisoli]SOD14810.1 hypothetical protein SAMN06297358_1767 [Pedobacter xixiisoli]
MTTVVPPTSITSLKFQVVEIDITPPKGIYSRNWGAAKFDVALGVHKALYLSCLVTQSNDGTLGAIIAADLGWWKNNDDERNLRKAIIEECGLKEEQLLFCLSHTHAGPSICTNDKDQNGGEHIIPYLEFLKNTAITSIHKAKDNLMDGFLSWEYGCCDLATKRDLNHQGEYLIGYDSSTIADHTLLLGKLSSIDGQLKAVICNYACHPTTFAHENTLISPDYVGAMRELIAEKLNVPTIFLQGASGDLAPKKQYVKEPETVDANGRKLGYAVLSTLENTSPVGQKWVFDHALQSGAPLAIYTEKEIRPSQIFRQIKFEVSIPYKQLDAVEKIEKEFEACEDRVMKDRLWRKLNTRKSIGDQTHALLPVWIWQFGDAFVIAQANEVYSIGQQLVRSHFKDRSIAFINIANGYLGYLPPQDLYGKDIYAVWQTPFEKGGLELLIAEIISRIEQLITTS